MEINAFKKISSVLSRTVHAITLCFDEITVYEANIEYGSLGYTIKLNCSASSNCDNFPFVCSSTHNSGHDAIKLFLTEILNCVEEGLDEESKVEKEKQDNWSTLRIHSQESGVLPEITSLNLLKGIIQGLTPDI